MKVTPLYAGKLLYFSKIWQTINWLNHSTLSSTTLMNTLIIERPISQRDSYMNVYFLQSLKSIQIYTIIEGRLTADKASRRRTGLSGTFTNVSNNYRSLIYCVLIWIPGNVWHGTQEPWHNWDILSGRFVSEFGMYAKFIFCSWYLLHSIWKRQGFPDIRTVDYWLGGNEAERFPQSRLVAFSGFVSIVLIVCMLDLTLIITKVLDLNED